MYRHSDDNRSGGRLARAGALVLLAGLCVGRGWGAEGGWPPATVLRFSMSEPVQTLACGADAVTAITKSEIRSVAFEGTVLLRRALRRTEEVSDWAKCSANGRYIAVLVRQGEADAPSEGMLLHNTGAVVRRFAPVGFFAWLHNAERLLVTAALFTGDWQVIGGERHAGEGFTDFVGAFSSDGQHFGLAAGSEEGESWVQVLDAAGNQIWRRASSSRGAQPRLVAVAAGGAAAACVWRPRTKRDEPAAVIDVMTERSTVSHRVPGGPICGAVSGDLARIVLATSKQRVLCLRVEDGGELWRADLTGRALWPHDTAMVGETAVVTARDVARLDPVTRRREAQGARHVLAFDHRGRLVWDEALPGGNYTAPADGPRLAVSPAGRRFAVSNASEVTVYAVNGPASVGSEP